MKSRSARRALAALVAVVVALPVLIDLGPVSAAGGWPQDFETATVGDHPFGWLDTGAGNSLDEDDSLFSVMDSGGSQVLGTTSTSTNIHSHYLDAPVTVGDGLTLTGRMMMTEAKSGLGVTFLSQYPSNDSYYRLRRYNGQGGTFRLSPHGTSLSGSIDTGVVPSPNTWYDYEIQVDDTGSSTDVRARVWESGTSKPTDWQASASDAGDSRLTSGSVGVWSMAAGEKYWDDIAVAGIAEPGPWSVDVTTSGSGSVARVPDQAEYEDGSTVELTASPAEGWSFAGWSGDVTGSDNPVQVVVDSDLAVQAAFVEDVAEPGPWSVDVTTSGSGSVARVPDQAEYEDGSTVELTASPAEGWSFAGWSGDVTGSDNPVQVVVDSDLAVQAEFTDDAAPTVDLTLGTFGQGSVSASPSPGPYDAGESITLAATPDSGWRFDRWVAAPAVGNQWWDARWGYRLGLDVGAAGHERTDAIVSAPVDFTAAFAELGVERVLDPVSIRVVEVDAAGAVVDGAVPFQFDPADGFDAGSSADGELWFELTGTTPASSSRSFDVYFDVVGTDLPAAVVAPRVTATDGVEHNGLETIEISTATGTYYYDTAGAGFASVIDTAGNDWVSWSDASGSAGRYRGIPNMVYPEGYFHPGNGGSSTSLVSSGPLVATFRSTTDDGLWKVEWSVTPDRARMRVLDADGMYWFLYEGTPGGVLEPASDMVVTADGGTTDASVSWSADLAGAEWVSFGDPAIGRSLYVANHQEDTAIDSYRPMNDEMTVFGFGRDGLSSELGHVPGVYTFGLVDATAHGDVAPVVERNTTPVTATLTGVESQLGADGAATATFAIERDTDVVAVFAEQGTESGLLDVQTEGPGSVTVDPDQPSYTVGDEVTLTAAPAQDAAFLGWSGDASGAQNPVTVTIDSSTSVTATFAAVGEGPTIDVWGGTAQYFGQLGVPQSAVNVLGNVSDPDGLASIDYRLNGGAARTPRLGPDGRRLARPGDFNVELAVADLNDGVNDLRITAVDGLGDVSIVDVAVHFDAGNVWPNPYTIDWSTVADVGDVAQVVDGKWAIEGDGLRIVEADYDRLVAIGDIAWDDYEIVFPVTINAIDERGFSSGPGGTSAGLGLLNRWGGHTDAPVVTAEPKSGWRPMGSIAWWFWDEIDSARVQIMNNGGGNMATTPYGTPPAVGSTLMYRMRVETQPDGTSQHSLKVWDSSDPEPSDWTLRGTQTDGRDTGSVVLLAHFVDATFGDVTVTPLGSEPTGLSVDVTTSGSGSVAVDPDQPEYASGDEVTLTATPDPDWVFTGWSGDISGTDNPVTITLSESIQVTANFAPVSGEPVISGVAVSPSTDSAVVSWSTDVSTTGSVAYGETTSYELGAVESSTSGTDHSVTIAGLTPETTYHFRITADDGQDGVSSTADATFATTAASEPSGFMSDDFNACAIDGSVWSFVDPVGDGSMAVNGTQLELSAPAGTSHDAWGANNAPRLMQVVNDADFELAAKFESTVSEKYEMQGWIIEQDAGNYLRFDVHGTGSGQRVFVAKIVNGSPTAIANKAISFSQPVWLRVGRSGDDWTMSYSTDGTAFTGVASFSHALAVTQAGVFAGNVGAAPEHTAVIDYVFDTTAPIADEDADAVTCP